MQDQNPSPQQQQPKSNFTRVEDFVTAYANSVQLLPSAWDLTLVFGELDQLGGAIDAVEQHTSVTLPWALAKVLHYYLTLQIYAHELEDAKIEIPKRVLPPEVPPLGEDLANNPLAVKIADFAIKLRRQLTGEQ